MKLLEKLQNLFEVTPHQGHTHEYLIHSGWDKIHSGVQDHEPDIYVHSKYPGHVILSNDQAIMHSVHGKGSSSRNHSSAIDYLQREFKDNK